MEYLLLVITSEYSLGFDLIGILEEGEPQGELDPLKQQLRLCSPVLSLCDSAVWAQEVQHSAALDDYRHHFVVALSSLPGGNRAILAPAVGLAGISSWRVMSWDTKKYDGPVEDCAPGSRWP